MTIDQINAELVTLHTALTNLGAGIIKEYSIGGRRVVYRTAEEVLPIIAYYNSLAHSQSAMFNYAGFGNPE